MVSTRPKARIALLLALGGLVAALCPERARAASAESLLQRVQAGGFNCTSSGGGSFCISGDRRMYILIPSGATIKKTVLYAHGNLGVCGKGNGLSGENYLKDQMAELGRKCAIGVMPHRQDPSGEGFPIDQYLNKLDDLLGTKLGAVIGGHSSGGHAISAALGRICSSQPNRIKDLVYFDAAYETVDGDLIKNALKSCKFKLDQFASSTIALARQHAQTVNSADAGAAQAIPVPEGHCEIPRAHLKDLVAKSNCDGDNPRDPPPAQQQPPQQPPPPPPPVAQVDPPPGPPPAAPEPSAQPFQPTEYPSPIATGGSRSSGPTDQRDDILRGGSYRRPALPVVPTGKHPPETPSSITKRGEAIPLAGQADAAEGGKRSFRPEVAGPRSGSFASGGASGSSPFSPSGAAPETRAPASAKAAGGAEGGTGGGSFGGGGARGASAAAAKEAAALASFKSLNTLGGAQGFGTTGAEMDAAIQNIQEKEFGGAATPVAEKNLFERHSAAIQRCQLRGCVRGELP